MTSRYVTLFRPLSLPFQKAEIPNNLFIVHFGATPNPTHPCRLVIHQFFANHSQLGTVVYTNITTYLDDTLSQPGPSEVDVIAIVHGCSSLIWYWQFLGVGGPTAQRVRGMTYTQVNSDKHVVSENVEFNTLTWDLNFGYTLVPPPAEKKMKRDWKA